MKVFVLIIFFVGLVFGYRSVGNAFAANPFAGHDFYVNPSYQKELDTSIATATGDVKATLQKMRDVASAYWLDVKSKVKGNGTDSLEGILAAAGSKLTVFIVYDLPNRDCHAKASNGEICCTKNSDGTCDYNAAGDCSAGIMEYQTQYIDPIASVLSKYSSQPIVLIIEPDSLPNLATNIGDPHCGNSATVNAYKTGIKYAISKISAAAPNIPMYLDAGHGGWLGWDDNLQKFGTLISEMGIAPKLRGFAQNVANYQPIGKQCEWHPQSSPTRNDYCLPDNSHSSDPCCSDPCKLESQWNPANNEMNYMAALSAEFAQKISGWKPYFVIDTGRNGVGNMRTDCANWCNPRGAGIGHVPTTATLNDTIDAYFWLKTPGESDGCTQTLPDGGQCARFDSFCGSVDSIGSKSGEPRAPEAGKWFDYQVKMLASNANMGGK